MQYSIDKRPRILRDIKGQEGIINDLLKKQRENKWPKAMLMKGIHGTGKTTTAQAIAMAIQCKNINDVGEPCMTCGSCKSIMEERYDRDTHMLDGALLSTKDNVTEKLELVNIAPMQDIKRVYMIEEANQLSGAAINAFHKILETPNDNVHFILLTMTDVGKSIPISIQSRCQVYSFKPFSVKDTMVALKELMVEEDLWEDEYIPNSFRLEGLATIANASKGSFRDAIQYLERCIAGKFYTPEAISENLGIIDESHVMKIIDALLDKDSSVWIDLNRMEPMDVYSLGFTILTNAMVYKVSHVILNDVYASSIKKMADHPGFEYLHDAFLSLGSERTFIRKSEILSALTNYWRLPIKKDIPVRTRRIKS